MTTTDLSEVLRLIKNDDAAAYKELYNRYKESIFLMVYRRVQDEEESKDIVQEIFLKLWLGIKTKLIIGNCDDYEEILRLGKLGVHSVISDFPLQWSSK